MMAKDMNVKTIQLFISKIAVKMYRSKNLTIFKSKSIQ